MLFRSAWNVTNTLILGAFVGVALREARGYRLARRAARAVVRRERVPSRDRHGRGIAVVS